MNSSCMRCGHDKYEVKNVYLPEKKNNIVGINFSLYYFKTCLKCGYTEMYSGKIVDKNEQYSVDY